MEITSSRPPLDRALAGRAFIVDEIACASAAKIVRQLVPSVSQPYRLRRSLSAEILLRLSIAAVCHNINWDFLSLRLARAFDESRIGAESLSSIRADQVEQWLSGYHRPERIRAGERAAFLRDIGRVLLDQYSGDAYQLLTRSEGGLHGQGGVLERLDAFAAFIEDPLRKKSNVFVHELVRDELMRFSDEGSIEPAIDYHIMRLYLRTGRVVPLHKETFDILRADSTPRPRLVKLLREAVGKALSLTALYAGLSVPCVNGVEWEIGREVCDRIKPRCNDAPPKWANPADQSCRCPNASFCQAYANQNWRELKEPDLKKSFY